MALPLLKTTVAILIVLFVAVSVRLISILPRQRKRPTNRHRGGQSHLMIVLGSGGHTAEMIAMLKNAIDGRPDTQGTQTMQKLDWSAFTHRTWIVSSGDSFSATRAKEFEHEVDANKGTVHSSDYEIAIVPRARKIHQPLWTSPFSSIQCLLACLKLLVAHPNDLPDIILTNGPATATVLIWASIILRFLNVRSAESRGKMRTIYVESWARVKKLSLSGRLLCYVADRVLVQWPQLEGIYGRGEYLGVLV